MLVNNLLGRGKVDCFSGLLQRCERLDPSEKVFIDGGAGLGETVEKILWATPHNSGPIIAYEPNPENVSRFAISDPRLTLVDAAISDAAGSAEFMVTSKTAKNADNHNRFHQSGTSFVGKLTPNDGGVRPDSAEYYPVRICRMDESLRSLGLHKADFVKLDLQGAETQALEGLGDLISTVNWMWIEFSNQPGLLDYLNEHKFVLFDTQYLFVGEKSDLIQELFSINRTGTNSIGKKIFFGNRRHVWRDYERAFTFARTKRRMIQTDMVAVAPYYLSVFLEAAVDMLDGDEGKLGWEVPRSLF